MKDYLTGVISVVTDSGDIEVARNSFTVDDYAQALAESKLIHKKNKHDSFVLQCLEQKVARLAHQRQLKQ